MVIRDFNIGWTCLSPSETNSILVIDTDAVLSFAISRKRLQAITRWSAGHEKRGQALTLDIDLVIFPTVFLKYLSSYILKQNL